MSMLSFPRFPKYIGKYLTSEIEISQINLSEDDKNNAKF